MSDAITRMNRINTQADLSNWAPGVTYNGGFYTDFRAQQGQSVQYGGSNIQAPVNRPYNLVTDSHPLNFSSYPAPFAYPYRQYDNTKTVGAPVFPRSIWDQSSSRPQ